MQLMVALESINQEDNMPFDESNISSESFKLGHTELVLTADKN